MEFRSIEIDDTKTPMDQMKFYAAMLYKRQGFVTLFVDLHPENPKASVFYNPGWDVMVVSDVRLHPHNTNIFWIDGVCKDKCGSYRFRKADLDEYVISIGRFSCYGKNRFRQAHPFPRVFVQYANEFASYIQSLDRPRMAQIDKLTWQQRLDLRKAQLEAATPLFPKSNKRKTKPQP